MITEHRSAILKAVAVFGTLLALMPVAGCSIITTDGGGTSSANTDNNATTKQVKDFGTIEFPKSGSLCSSPIAIAVEMGYFKEEGITPKLVTADAETRKVGLDTGRFPITNGDFQFFPSIEKGVKTSVVGALHKGCIKIAVKKGSSIKTAADLKGKTIGVDEIGGTPYMAANLWLGDAGLNVDQKNGDVKYLPFDDANLEFEALQNGQIDAAALWDPLPTIQEQKGTVDIIFDLGSDPKFSKRFCCFIYGSNKVIKENPEEMAAILRALNKARDYIAQHPEDAAKIITEKKYSTITDQALAVKLFKDYDYAVQTDESSLIESDVDYFVDGLKKIGFLETSDTSGFAKKIYQKIDL
ncbi:ABC transporter substrate-binding protein [Bifidobacterium aerophilum]|uniref:ABC transporter substrate-binding protein n=1 Tax=Bifidobacterium aerophilum TaxID=1798155 RepID=A0A6N9Z204_9BIFI|nr:ABC transporter substrate-binding protein [Bifidobacterium aerophilum]NEG88481.1 ABC transporter substrate-binding protein [Bifidobacterium aerophilum]